MPSNPLNIGGAEGDRTPDPLNAIQVFLLLIIIFICLAGALVANYVYKCPYGKSRINAPWELSD